MADCRKGRGLSQAALGKMLGKSKATVSRWETFRVCPTLDDFLMVCWEFNLDPLDYLWRSDTLRANSLQSLMLPPERVGKISQHIPKT